MEFARSGNALYLTARNHGRISVYKFDLRSRTGPEMLFRGGTVRSCYPHGEDDTRVLITSSSFVDGSLYSIVNTDGSRESRALSSLTNHGARLGISSSQISEIYFKGAVDDHVHAWMVKPGYFEEGRKYPLMICVHGGPMRSWDKLHEQVKSWFRKIFSREVVQEIDEEEQKSASKNRTQLEYGQTESLRLDSPPRLDVSQGPTLSDSLSDTGFILSEPSKKKKSGAVVATDMFRYSFRSDNSRPVSMVAGEGSK
ncbi:hypothetical protein F4811DRAFT_552292 [Daldinia bambusicola]|nr:hypothetical protein F4811DRAFT_552292 [Daldinia bambusicola]